MFEKEVYLNALKRYIKTVGTKEVVECYRYNVEYEDDINESYMLCLVDKGVDIGEIDINDSNINLFKAYDEKGNDISYTVRCIIPSKYVNKSTEGILVSLEAIEKGYIRVNKNTLNKDELFSLKLINNKVKLGL